MSGGVFRRAAWQRVNECYAWKGYAERLMPLSLVYGFWRYVTELERGDITLSFPEMFYILQFRPLANAVRHCLRGLSTAVRALPVIPLPLHR